MTKLNISKKFKTVLLNPSSFLYFVYGKLNYFPTGIVINKTMRDIPIYCISLKQATTRRSFMDKQVAKAGFTNFNFIDSVDALSLNIDTLMKEGIYNDALSKKYHGRSLNLGEIACSLSHGKIYEIIAKTLHPFALILEDDALFVTKRINAVDISIFPSGWDIVFLNSFYSSTPPEGNIKNNLYSTQSWKGSCAAYLISLKGATKLAKSYKPVFHAADGFVGRCMACPEDHEHDFKGQGGATIIDAYLIFPDCILNGSSVGFWNTTLPVNF